MRLFLLFLIIASTPFASTDLALASTESQRSNAVESDSVQRYLRANSTNEEEDEERQFDNQQILTDIERFLPRLSGFSYGSIKLVAELYFKMMEYQALALPYPPAFMDGYIIDSLFTNKLVEELLRWTSLRYEQYIDIALYLVLLEKVGGSIRETAKEIDRAMTWANDLAIASRMENGQFHLWNHILKTEDRVKAEIFESRLDILWRKNTFERFRNFLANEESVTFPGW